MKYLYPFLFLIPMNSICQIQIKETSYKQPFFQDLRFLEKELDGKNIICLGEEWHGTETFSEIKNRIVKYLHQELKYHHIIFESSIYSPWVVEKNQLKGKNRLLETLPTIWRTQSVLDLIKYIDQSEQTHLPIKQYGMDLQGDYTNSFSKELVALFKTIAPELVQKITKVEALIQKEWINRHKTFKRYKTVITTQEVSVYTNMIEQLKTTQSIQLAPKEKNKIIWLLQNRIFLCHFLMNKKGKFYREKILSQNLEWLIKSIGKDEKIIIWAADLHISKKQAKTYKGAQKSMLELLPSSLLEKIYSLSLIPIESLKAKSKRKLVNRNGRFFFYSMAEDNELNDKDEEFDGQIICKQTKPIDQYLIK